MRDAKEVQEQALALIEQRVRGDRRGGREAIVASSAIGTRHKFWFAKRWYGGVARWAAIEEKVAVARADQLETVIRWLL